MPKHDLDVNETTIVLEGLELLAKSAKRAQNTGRTPQIKEVYAQHEKTIAALTYKIANAK